MEGIPFGRYRLIELLGRGGMGEVWRAYDTEIDRVVALKMLLAQFGADATFEQRFRREARAAARLDDPHVVPIYDVGEIDGRLYVTMRLIKGHDLQSLLSAGPLEPARAVAIIGQVAAALHSAHEVGLIHRDVKPSNVLVTDDDFAYLIDFGIARSTGETGLTSAGATVGTWSYMAPERFRDGELAPSSDVYALACVLHQCLTGQLPFPGSTLEQIVAAHLASPPPKPSYAIAAIPAAMDDVIAAGMAKDPARRYRTTKDLAGAARAAITRAPQRPGPVLPPPRASAPTPPETALRGERKPVAPHPLPSRAPETAVRNGPTRSPNPPIPNRQAVQSFYQSPTQHSPPSPVERTSDAAPAKPTRAPRFGPRKKIAVVIGAVVIVLGIATLVVPGLGQQTFTANTPSSVSRSPWFPHKSTQPANPSQTALSFTGLTNPVGVAVDSTGAVYVADSGTNSVVKLTADSLSQTALPFTGLNGPAGVAVDSTGAVYVADSGNNRVVKLAAGSSAPTVLPFNGLDNPQGVTVDSRGTVYVIWGIPVKLEAGSLTQTVLPTVGFDTSQNQTWGGAVDGAGTLYAANSGTVVKLAAGSSSWTALASSGLSFPRGVAVDSAGTVYATNTQNNQVVKLAPNSSSWSDIQFTGLDNPQGVAVDSAGAVYVADSGNHRVVKLAAG